MNCVRKIRCGRELTVQTCLTQSFGAKAVAIAPTVIYFDVEDSFAYYSGGIYVPDPKCGSKGINHAMVAVGYEWGGSSSTSYW